MRHQRISRDHYEGAHLACVMSLYDVSREAIENIKGAHIVCVINKAVEIIKKGHIACVMALHDVIKEAVEIIKKGHTLYVSYQRSSRDH